MFSAVSKNPDEFLHVGMSRAIMLCFFFFFHSFSALPKEDYADFPLFHAAIFRVFSGETWPF